MRIIQEPKDGRNILENAPIVLRAEDLYIKSGAIALTTDNSKGNFFDNFKVESLVCFQDPFDSDKATHYNVITNRYKEKYLGNIN